MENRFGIEKAVDNLRFGEQVTRPGLEGYLEMVENTILHTLSHESSPWRPTLEDLQSKEWRIVC